MFQLPLSEKNYSLRYEPSKMPISGYFLLVGVAKRDVTGIDISIDIRVNERDRKPP